MAVFYLQRAGGQLVVVCLSTDTKPSSANGTALWEIDTGILYFRTGGSWTAVNTPASGFVTTGRIIATTSPLAGGGDLSANRTLSLSASGVTAGSYTNANITVTAEGLISLAANGSSGSGDPYTGYLRPGLYSNPTSLAGNFTIGMRFRMTTAQIITGVQFFVPSALNGKNFKCQLWDDAGTSLKNVTVTGATTGTNTGTFASSQAVTAGTIYRVSVYETTGGNYMSDALLPANFATLYMIIGSQKLFSAGDANPNSDGGSERYPLNPVFA